MLVCQHPAAAAEIRVYRRDISVVSMAIASTRIRLPHFDERVGYRATVAIENVAVDDGLFANRFAGFWRSYGSDHCRADQAPHA